MPQDDYSLQTLHCEECREEAQAGSVGWLVFEVDLPDDPDPAELVVYCPECAARELGTR